MSRQTATGDQQLDRSISRRRLLGWSGLTAGAALAGHRITSPGAIAAQEAGDEQLVLVTLGLDAARNLHPVETGFTINRAIAGQIMEALVALSPVDLSPYPRLAEEIQVSEDGRVLTFPLRSGVTFHNGDPLTAEDVHASLLAIIGSETGANTRGRIFTPELLEGIDTPDERTVVIRLTRPDATVLEALSALYVAPKRLLEEEPDSLANPINRMPVGTGPYRITAHESDDIDLEINSDYWGAPANIERIYFRGAGDGNAVAASLRTGENDIAEYDATAMEGLDRQAGLTLLTSPAAEVTVFRWTIAEPKFSDQRVRQALSVSLDRESIVAAVFNGWAEPTGQFLPSVHAFHNPDIPTPPFDLDLAAALMDEAGWVLNSDGIREKDGELYSFEVGAQGKSSEDLALVAQQTWKALGLDVSIRLLADFATLREYATTNAPFFISTGTGVDSGFHVNAYYGRTPHWGPRWTTPHDEVIAQIDRVNSEMDYEARKLLFRELGVMLATELPEIYICHPTNGVIHKPALEGVTLNHGAGWDGWATHMQLWSWAS